MPACDWKSRTALVTVASNVPLTGSVRRRFAFSSTCSARTAGPDAPALICGTSLPHVAGPTIPSTPSPWADWNDRTAASVDAPNTPSVGVDTPWWASRYWIASTSAPRLPVLWVWKYVLGKAFAGELSSSEAATAAAAASARSARRRVTMDHIMVNSHREHKYLREVFTHAHDGRPALEFRYGERHPVRDRRARADAVLLGARAGAQARGQDR